VHDVPKPSNIKRFQPNNGGIIHTEPYIQAHARQPIQKKKYFLIISHELTQSKMATEFQ
jgi:hypothetical protein